jgi:BMFP domain-containing protein YqiC
MQTQNRLLDDLARVASGVLGVAAGMRAEVEARLREQFERVLAQLDLVTREEFDAVKAMAVKAREEQEVLAAQLAKLETAIGPETRSAKPRQGAGRKQPAGKGGAAKKTAGRAGAAGKGGKAA